jgi:broad specificity phosphatase PhoE
MGKLLIVRHAEKGNGSDTGMKFHLSPAGQAAAMEFGRNLPDITLEDDEVFSKCITYIGGSAMSRSLHTALLIAIGAGADPKILPSDRRLGSEDQLFNEFGITIANYADALKQCDGSEYAALKLVTSKYQLQML